MVLGRLGAAVAGAVNGFTTAWSEPLGAMGQSLGTDRQRRFDELWAWYTSEMFGATNTRTAARWGAYRQANRLYRHTRLLYNPCPRLVETYVSTIYPGILPLDGRQPPQGVQVAIPLPDDTTRELRAAITQVFQWSNWGSEKSAYVRFGAALGSVLLEAVDDSARGKVSIRVWRPEYVPSVTLDTAGNVKAYALEYRTVDDNAQPFMYRREWDQDGIRTYKDGNLAAFGDDPAERPNPYPFVPACLLRHKSTGGDWGAAAIEPVLPMLRGINSTASMLDDALDKKVRLPFVIFGGGDITSLSKKLKQAPTDELGISAADMDREGILMWHGAKDGTVATLAPTLETADTAAWVRDKIARAEEMLPEITYSRELRSMSTVTGPGAARMLSDVGAIVYEAQSIYDLQLTKALQMCLAMGGERARAGAWGMDGRSLTRQQQVFTPFDMQSYERGEMDIAILPRPLVPATDRERIDELVQEAAAAKGWEDAGMPLTVFLKRERGWSDEDIAQLGKDKVEAIRMQQLLAQEDVVPVVGQ